MKNEIITYNPKLKGLAKTNRKNLTKGELILWSQLKGRQIDGVRFSRQICVSNCILDFYCKELKLAVEVQGYSHNIQDLIDKDIRRIENLKQLGVKVIEIDERDIFNDLDNVIAQITHEVKNIKDNTHPAHDGGHPSKEGIVQSGNKI